MNPKSFLFGKLQELVGLVPSIRLRYEFDEISNDHLVEVLPIEVYRDNEHYIRLENEIALEFAKVYPYESVIFLTKGSLIRVDNPEKEFFGLFYNIPKWSPVIVEESCDFKHPQANYQDDVYAWDESANCDTYALAA